LGSKVTRLFALQVVLIVELVDLFGILSVSFSQVMELIFEMLLLLQKLVVQILVLTKVGFQTGDFDMSAIEDLLLGIKLGIKVSVLFFPIDQEISLVVDFSSEG